MGTKRSLAALLLAAGLAAASGLAAGQANPRVAARDQLIITVWGIKDWSTKYLVSPDGSIDFPEIGRVKVAGLTAREAADQLMARVKSGGFLLDPQVTVELAQTPNKRVNINGSVRTQGPVPFAGEITLLEAVTRAGGRLPDAADEVLIVRAAAAAGAGTDPSPEPTVIEINIREIENGELANNITLQDGDNVFVRKAQAVTITGHVKSVGAYNIQPGTNVEQALALAGGIAERGSDRRIEITRKENGKTVTLKGVKMTDPVKPGDIIKVGPRIL